MKQEVPQNIVVKSSVDKAVEGMNKKKDGKLYGGFTPEKGAVISEIVSGTLADLAQSISRPACTYDNLPLIQERTAEYLQACIDHQSVPLIEGWAVALGVSRKTLYQWFDNTKSREVFDFLERVRTMVFAANAQAAYKGAINAVAWIFYGKNSLGMTDKTELQVSAQPINPLGEETPPEELRQKYLDAIAAEDIDG